MKSERRSYCDVMVTSSDSEVHCFRYLGSCRRTRLLVCRADGLGRILNATEEQVTGQEDGKHRGRVGRVSRTKKVHLRMKEEIKLFFCQDQSELDHRPPRELQNV